MQPSQSFTKKHSNERKTSNAKGWILPFAAAIAGLLVGLAVHIHTSTPTSTASPLATSTPDTTFLAQGYAELARQAQPSSETLSLWGLLGSLALPVLLVILCFILAARGLRALNQRFTQTSSSSGLLLVLDSLPLGSAGTLFLVQLGQRVMLIGASGQQVTLLGELTDEEAHALRTSQLHSGHPSSGQLARRFRDLLSARTDPRLLTPAQSITYRHTPPPSASSIDTPRTPAEQPSQQSATFSTEHFGYHPPA